MFDDPDDDDLDPDHIDEVILELVASGHTTVDEIVDQLVEEGVRSPPDIIADAVEDQLIHADVWIFGGRINSVPALLEGRIFTWRLTPISIERDAISTATDLAAVGSGLEAPRLADGTALAPIPVDEWGPDQLDYRGPHGWLAGFEPGQLLGFRCVGGRWAMEAVAEPAAGEREAAALVASFQPLLAEDKGEELFPHLFNALAADESLFREPTLPVSDLLAGAGLVRHRHSFGPAGRIWNPAGYQPERARADVARRYGLDHCCRTALDQVADHWRAHELGLAKAPGVPSIDAVVIALGHGDVVPAFLHLVSHHGVADDLARFAAEARHHAPTELGPILLEACLADDDGRTADAERLCREALAIDHLAPPAITRLAWMAFDRGDPAEANRQFRLVLEPAAPEIAATEHLARLLPTPGRNDRCPCGSGRKYKACHQGQLVAPPATRPAVLLAKLSQFVTRRPVLASTIEMAALRALEDVVTVEDLADDPVLWDQALFDPATIEVFLRERGDLLPSEEVDLLHRIAGAELRLLERIDHGAGPDAWFRDLESGREVPGRGPADPWWPGVGSCIGARMIDGELIGPAVPVANRDLAVSFLKLARDAPDPRHLSATLMWCAAVRQPFDHDELDDDPDRDERLGHESGR